jgi:transcriptional regulator with XRE-family HTH domain
MPIALEALPQTKLHRVVADLGGQSAVAAALGVHRSRVSRWLAGERPDPDNLAKLEGLEFVLAQLSRRMSATTARKWLTGVNAELGHRRPVDLILHNRIAEVLGAIEQTDLDSYA